VAAERDRGPTGTDFVVTEGRSIAAIGAEVVGASAEGSNVKAGSDLGVGQLKDRTKGDGTEPLATNGLGVRVSRGIHFKWQAYGGRKEQKDQERDRSGSRCEGLSPAKCLRGRAT
jgi:hypothetical protein